MCVYYPRNYGHPSNHQNDGVCWVMARIAQHGISIARHVLLVFSYVAYFRHRCISVLPLRNQFCSEISANRRGLCQVKWEFWKGRPLAPTIPNIGFPEMLAPEQSVTPVARRQQCGVDFEGRCTRQRPSAVDRVRRQFGSTRPKAEIRLIGFGAHERTFDHRHYWTTDVANSSRHSGCIAHWAIVQTE